MSDISPKYVITTPLVFFPTHVAEGPECTCSLCGLAIGAEDHDPRWEKHDPACAGCDICEIAVRLYSTERNPSFELGEGRLHVKCMEIALCAGRVRLGAA